MMGTLYRRALVLLVGAALLLSINPAAATELGEMVRGGDVSIAVAARGKTLFEHQGARRRTPASVQKLLLSMALFDEFGPRHRLATRVMSNGSRGVVDDLWVAGGGDPTIVIGRGDGAHTGVARIARRIERSGIQRVRGAVILDSSALANDWHAPGWQTWSRRFAARATALALDGNHSAHPSLAFGRALTATLERRGVAVGGEPRFGRTPRRTHRIATVRSAPLSALASHMNVTSSNFYAEMLGKVLGRRVFGAPGTVAKGARAIERFAARRGVNVTAHDSSGLSYANRVSARGVVSLLERVRQEPWGRRLRVSLPRPGRGTLAGRLPGLPMWAKTGTLWNGSSALAGWVMLRGGATAEFAILARGASKAREDTIVRSIATRMKAPPRQPRDCKYGALVTGGASVTRCQGVRWWEEIGLPARTPE
jgi:serine-type D-Ala-D-Ala carboxypeptidase/endopeptidase (penicillin-binding protein 4)